MNATEALEEDEETVLEYAEYHGLASNPFEGTCVDTELLALQEHLKLLNISDAGLYQIPHTTIKFPEFRLTLDKDAALLLRDANQDFVDHDSWSEMSKACKATRINMKKLDLPLLRTDPDVDLETFKARVNQPSHHDDGFLPAEPLNEESDQGLTWPSYMQTLPTKEMAELRAERSAFPKKSILFLLNMAKDNWMNEDTEKMLRKEHTYIRNAALDPVTPPLSPAFLPEYEPFVPSSPGCILPLLSDPASLLAGDLEAVEHKIFDDDRLGGNERSSQPDEKSEPAVDAVDRRHSRPKFQELESLPSDEHFPLIERNKKEDLAIDAGLTPPMLHPTFPKTVTFSDEVETMLLDDDYSDEESSRTGSRNEGIMAWDASVDDALRAASERANSKLQHEQLQEPATTKKFPVPVLEFPALPLPWNLPKVLRSDKKLLTYQADIVADALKANNIPAKVHGLHRLQESLRWAPFPKNLARVALSEDLDGSKGSETFIRTTSGVTTSEDVIFKREMPRCLQELEDNDDEELEAADFLKPEVLAEELDSLLKTRKHDLEDAREHCDHEARKPKFSDVNETITSHKRQAEDMTGGLVGAFDSYSATSALDNFMETRGKKKPKLTTSDYFAPRAMPQTRLSRLPLTPQATAAQGSKSLAISLPAVSPSANPTPFIISTTLMQIRPIVKVITSLYPTAELIERDFSKHNESSWMKGSVKSSPVVSPLVSEADIILSPSTGLIITTLAKIKQKPLPGQKTKVKIIEKVEGVTQRYAKVLVLVSEGSQDDTIRSLSGQDAMAYAEFVGFCNTQEAVVTPIYVPGGPKTLGTWIASAMVKHGIHDGSQASLMEDETIWELFLRRCGMNAYAAQSVIAAMRAPEGVNARSPNKAGMFGLPEFVQMDHAERVRQFADLLGGTRVLERVSAAIDTPWRPPTPLMGPNLVPLLPPYSDAVHSRNSL